MKTCTTFSPVDSGDSKGESWVSHVHPRFLACVLVFAELAHPNYKKSIRPRLWPCWMIFFREETVSLWWRNNF